MLLRIRRGCGEPCRFEIKFPTPPPPRHHPNFGYTSNFSASLGGFRPRRCNVQQPDPVRLVVKCQCEIEPVRLSRGRVGAAGLVHGAGRCMGYKVVNRDSNDQRTYSMSGFAALVTIHPMSRVATPQTIPPVRCAGMPRPSKPTPFRPLSPSFGHLRAVAERVRKKDEKPPSSQIGPAVKRRSLSGASAIDSHAAAPTLRGACPSN